MPYFSCLKKENEKQQLYIYIYKLNPHGQRQCEWRTNISHPHPTDINRQSMILWRHGGNDEFRGQWNKTTKTKTWSWCTLLSFVNSLKIVRNNKLIHYYNRYQIWKLWCSIVEIWHSCCFLFILITWFENKNHFGLLNYYFDAAFSQVGGKSTKLGFIKSMLPVSQNLY